MTISYKNKKKKSAYFKKYKSLKRTGEQLRETFQTTYLKNISFN